MYGITITGKLGTKGLEKIDDIDRELLLKATENTTAMAKPEFRFNTQVVQQEQLHIHVEASTLKDIDSVFDNLVPYLAETLEKGESTCADYFGPLIAYSDSEEGEWVPSSERRKRILAAYDKIQSGQNIYSFEESYYLSLLKKNASTLGMFKALQFLRFAEHSLRLGDEAFRTNWFQSFKNADGAKSIFPALTLEACTLFECDMEFAELATEEIADAYDELEELMAMTGNMIELEDEQAKAGYSFIIQRMLDKNVKFEQHLLFQLVLSSNNFMSDDRELLSSCLAVHDVPLIFDLWKKQFPQKNTSQFDVNTEKIADAVEYGSDNAARFGMR